MIVENISKYLKIKELKVSAVEREIGVSNGTLSKPIKDNKTIKTDTLEKFLSIYTDINTYWLFTGQGEMLLNETGLTNTYKSNNATRNEGENHPLSPLEEKKGGNLKLNNDDDDDLGLGKPKENIFFYQKLVDKQADWIDQMQDQADVLIKMVSQRDVIIRKQHKELQKFKNKDTGTSVG